MLKKIMVCAFAVILCTAVIGNIISSAVSSSYAAAAEEEESSKTDNTLEVSTSSEAYREYVTKYATQCGLTNYVDIILQMIDVYLPNTVGDVMGASYTRYNKQYPHQSNAITSPAYSIQCGMQEMQRLINLVQNKYKVIPYKSNYWLKIVLETYEYQDDGYIEYAKNNKGYSITTAQDYKAKSKTAKTSIDYSFAINVVNFGLITTDKAAPWQMKIVEVTVNCSKYSSVRTVSQMCLQFVNDVYDTAGVGGARKSTARAAGAYFGCSNNWNNIPVGAQVYGYSNCYAGHVGIYIGNGLVVSCLGGSPWNSITKVVKYFNGGFIGEQSLKSFVSEFNCQCWGFGGTHSDQYPYYSFKYMNL